MKVKSDHRSKFSNLSNWKEEAWKIQGFKGIPSNPWAPRYRCDALPTELWSHTLGARSIYWVHIFPCSEMMWSICEIIHIWTAELNKLTSLPMCGFISQLVEHRTGIAEFTGLNPNEAWFLQASSFQLRKLENFTAMITLHFHFEWILVLLFCHQPFERLQCLTNSFKLLFEKKVNHRMKYLCPKYFPNIKV